MIRRWDFQAGVVENCASPVPDFIPAVVLRIFAKSNEMFFEGMRPLYLAPQLDLQAVVALAADYGLIVTGPPLTE